MKKIAIVIMVMLVAVATFAKDAETKPETKAPAEAMNVEFTGMVTDKISNEALVGVEVKIEGTNLKTYTDFDGKFAFNNLQPGEYKLITNYISYQKNIIEKVDINKNNTQLVIKLEASN